MGGIEVLAATVIFIIGLVGLIRGPSREMGVTMALVFLLAMLAQFDVLVGFNEFPVKLNNILSGAGMGSNDPVRRNMTVLFFYSAAVIMTAFLAYHGQATLQFSFSDPRGVLGAAAGWFVGVLNGYLMFGTIWYYMDRLDYPISQYSWFTKSFTSTAMTMISLLPQNLFSSLALAAFALVLLWWRILR